MRRLAAVLVVVLIAIPLTSSEGLGKGRDRLPNLVPLAPSELWGPETGMLPSFGYGYPAPPVAINGCLADEISRSASLRCLRFDTTVANLGAGHFEVLYKAEAPAPGAYQVIYQKDGTTRERFAVESEYHPTHLHFHFRDFYSARLWSASKSGQIEDSQPVAVGSKSGFCPEDTARAGGGGGDARYSCIGDYRTDELPPGQIVGISSGWGDTYRMHLPDQYIEISEVPDGLYVLQLTIDPDDYVAESNEGDNSICVPIELRGTSAILKRAASTQCNGIGRR